MLRPIARSASSSARASWRRRRAVRAPSAACRPRHQLAARARRHGTAAHAVRHDEQRRRPVERAVAILVDGVPESARRRDRGLEATRTASRTPRPGRRPRRAARRVARAASGAKICTGVTMLRGVGTLIARRHTRKRVPRAARSLRTRQRQRTRGARPSARRPSEHLLAGASSGIARPARRSCHRPSRRSRRARPPTRRSGRSRRSRHGWPDTSACVQSITSA